MEASPYPVYEDARTRFKHQSLIQDYQELEKETGAMKNRMQIMQQKKLTLLAEVRFLRRRYRYLDEKQPMKSHQMQRDHPQLQNHDIRKSTVTKGKKYRKKESAFRYPAIPLDLNQKVMNYSGMEVSLQKSAPVLVLNQKVKNLSVQDASVPNFRPTFDLNQQERIHSGKEAAKRKNTPVFDLNQISGEEEEFQANLEPFRREEPKKGLLRSVNEEQHNDMKLLVCRNIGNGSNRAGKRKITWQDQVALRV
ncbi:ribosomal RNA small subunit methyltransferase G [Parasponia andersonii]|uniref:Ribosomal RNA small subunit methyltransferase G n=1 Tax=Parasponia andersonii TaxID=3476 RepID=A0A2P5AZF5_PARAD|nr:ribosomal RNA small subunit methyltransferase G [Parasponia andersonii]